MSHALIIDDNMIVGRAVENQLIPLGFDSFDHCWTEPQAIAAAECRAPDLVIVGDSIADGSPVEVARNVSGRHHAPMLMITAMDFRLHCALSADACLSGPFQLHEMGEVVALSRQRID